MAHTWEWTYEDYAALPDDGNRYEVIDGEVCMTPAPGFRNQHVAANLFVALRAYVNEYKLGRMIWDIDLLFMKGQYLRPDMLFVPTTAMSGITERGLESKPGLVVEVLSPHSGKYDRVKKPPRYRDFGVAEYWVVDPKNKAVEVYQLAAEDSAPTVFTEVLHWQPDPEVEPLALDLSEVFEGIA